jgi:small subunit ribosomal protein S21
MVKNDGEVMGTNYSVKVRKKDNIERVIKRFIKKCKKLGIIDEVKDRRHYTKPSEKKRRAKQRAIRRHKKELSKRKN